MIKYVCDENSTVKLHICETEAVASAVCADISARFPDTSPFISDSKNTSIHIDFGGSMRMGWTPIVIDDIADVPISFWAHQFETLLKKLQSGNRDGGFVKVHGPWNAICLDHNTAERLLSRLLGSYDNLLEKCKQQISEWEEAVSGLAGHPNILLPEKPNPSECN